MSCFEETGRLSTLCSYGSFSYQSFAVTCTLIPGQLWAKPTVCTCSGLQILSSSCLTSNISAGIPCNECKCLFPHRSDETSIRYIITVAIYSMSAVVRVWRNFSGQSGQVEESLFCSKLAEGLRCWLLCSWNVSDAARRVMSCRKHFSP